MSLKMTYLLVETCCITKYTDLYSMKMLCSVYYGFYLFELKCLCAFNFH